MIRIFSCFGVLLAFVLFTGSLATAGFVVHKETRELNDMTGQTHVETRVNYYDTENGKFAGDDGIMRFDTGEMIILNPTQKIYYRNTLDGYCNDIEDVVKELTSSPEYKQLKEMAEKAQKELKEQYGDQPLPESPKPTLRKIGQDKIAGFSADHYQVRIGSDIDRDVWIATDPRLDDLDVSKNSRLKKKALAFENKLHTCLGKFNQFSPQVSQDKDPLENATSFELRSKDNYTEELVISIKEQNVPASRFEPPNNFRKASFKEYMSFSRDEANQAFGESNDTEQPSVPPQMTREVPSRTVPEKVAESDQQKGWVQKDAKDVGQHAAKETHDQTKKAVKDQITDTVKEGVKGFMKLFGN